MKRLRVLVLMHEDLVPPETLDGYSDKEIARWKSEFDVVATLREMGHEAEPLGMSDDLGVLRSAILGFRPHVAFNMLEEFHGVAVYDHHVTSYLELMRQPYTGCNPRGLLLSHDKVLSKQILFYHRIPTPQFTVFPLGKAVRTPRRLKYPLLVKSAIEDASMGISQASIVHDADQLIEQIRFVHEQVQSDAIAEQYIEGRELYVGITGNQRLQAFPVWEMLFERMPDHLAKIATAQVKFDPAYQKQHGIVTRAAQDLTVAQHARIIRVCKRVYRVLSLSGYARLDLRVTPQGQIYVLEANPNPNLEYGEDFAESAESIGITYELLLQRILSLGLRYKAAWRT